MLATLPPHPAPSPIHSPLHKVQEMVGLSTIADQMHDAVAWSRSLPAFVTQTLATTPLGEEKDARFVLAPSNSAEAVRATFEDWNLTLGRAAAWLADDIQSLATTFARALSSPAIALRLEVIEGDACRKFHRDAVRARLICAYVGPGTEYGPGLPGETPTEIHHLPTGHPAIFKGKAWQPPAPHSLLHRSPPISETPTTRLLLVIDEARAS